LGYEVDLNHNPLDKDGIPDLGAFEYIE